MYDPAVDRRTMQPSEIGSRGSLLDGNDTLPSHC